MPQNTLGTLGFVRNSFKDLPSSTEVAKENIGIINTSMDRYRENQKLALMEAAEHLGIPFSKISNQMAGIDPSLAIKLASEDRNSMEWNREESEAEFKQYREEMARKLFSAVLQRGIRDVKEGLYDNSQLAGYCNQAASYIAAFDAELAERLLRFAEDKLSSDLAIEVKLANLNKEKSERNSDLYQIIQNAMSGLRDPNAKSIEGRIFNQNEINATQAVLAREDYINETRVSLGLPKIWATKDDVISLLNMPGNPSQKVYSYDKYKEISLSDNYRLDAEDPKSLINLNNVDSQPIEAPIGSGNGKSVPNNNQNYKQNKDNVGSSIDSNQINEPIIQKRSYVKTIGYNNRIVNSSAANEDLEKFDNIVNRDGILNKDITWNDVAKELYGFHGRYQDARSITDGSVGNDSDITKKVNELSKTINERVMLEKEALKALNDAGITKPEETLKPILGDKHRGAWTPTMNMWSMFINFAEGYLTGNISQSMNISARLTNPFDKATDFDTKLLMQTSNLTGTSDLFDKLKAAYAITNQNSVIGALLSGDAFGNTVIQTMKGIIGKYRTLYNSMVTKYGSENTNKALKTLGASDDVIGLLNGHTKLFESVKEAENHWESINKNYSPSNDAYNTRENIRKADSTYKANVSKNVVGKYQNTELEDISEEELLSLLQSN